MIRRNQMNLGDLASLLTNKIGLENTTRALLEEFDFEEYESIGKNLPVRKIMRGVFYPFIVSYERNNIGGYDFKGMVYQLMTSETGGGNNEY